MGRKAFMDRFKLERIEGSRGKLRNALVMGPTVLFALILGSGAGAATPGTNSVVGATGPLRSNANLVVLSVLEPVPPGAQPGGGMYFQATVSARYWNGRNAKVVFYLAQDNVPGASDVPIASANIGSAPGAYMSVAAAAHVPPTMPPGFYFVLACAGASNCAASQGTIHVIGQSLSVVNQAPGSIAATPPATEYFPERPADGMSVGSPFACPISFHGQFPSNCVWVTTKLFTGGPFPYSGLFYCPSEQPYPYEVAIGFDPLWNDLSSVGSKAFTNNVSFTKYKSNGNFILSYGGLDPSDSAQRGYSFFIWDISFPDVLSKGQVQFLCSDRRSNSALP
jgi:hypothetical protein